MAFTLAHPAAVLPLRKLPFVSLLPLLIGSMTPDLVGFLPRLLERHLRDSHSWLGTVLIDLPLGYLLLILLCWCRAALVQPLWEPHRELVARGIDEFFTRSHRWLIAAPSLLIGSWTHIVWDRFTHEDRWTYHHLPALYQPVFPDAAHPLPLFHFLQYATSVVGLIYIGWHYHAAIKQLKGDAPMIIFGGRKAYLILGLGTAALMVGMMRLMSISGELESRYDQLALVLKTALMCFGALYLASGLLLIRTSR